jgi:hypothetical protein
MSAVFERRLIFDDGLAACVRVQKRRRFDAQPRRVSMLLSFIEVTLRPMGDAIF